MKRTINWSKEKLKKDYGISNPTDREIDWIIKRTVDSKIDQHEITKNLTKKYKDENKYVKWGKE